MKKLLLSVFLLSGLVLFANSNAQAQFAIKGGVNFATFNDTDASADSRTGLMAGISYGFQIPFSPVSIQPGVFYTQKGAKYSEGSAETTTKLDYIEVPVVAKFDFVLDNPMLTPHVYFGPYVGFNINAEQEFPRVDGEASGDIEDRIKKTDFGVVVGAGADISKFNLGVRYSAGLTSIYDNGGDAKNGVFSIVAGFNF